MGHRDEERNSGYAVERDPAAESHLCEPSAGLAQPQPKAAASPAIET
jgi:hypothetical protein